MDRSVLLFWGSTGLDVLGVVVLALVLPRLPRGARAAALGVAALAWLLKLGLVRTGGLGVNPFWAPVHLLFLDAVVVLPLAGALLAWRARRRVLRAAGVVALLAAPAGAYAARVEPYRLTVTETRVAVAPERAGERPLRVAVLADLQTERVGAHERRAVDRVVALRPDLILLPGDLHQGSRAALARELPALRGLLRRLRAPGGAFFAPGDQEDGDEAQRVLRGTGVRLLENGVARVRIGDRHVTIAGLELDYDSPRAQAVSRRLERAGGRRDVRLLLTHRPDAALRLSGRGRVDIVVAGHTHGGQIRLPLVGPPWVGSGVGREVGAGGLHDLGSGRRIFVSRGVGVERGDAPQVRFRSRPEVALLVLDG
jgi:hypothetical protein